jgi:transglutaminase-like putative cysteine protease
VTFEDDNQLLRRLIRWFRPRVGWPAALLGLATVLCPALAVTDSPLNLPVALFGWAGLIGLLAGMRGPTTDDRRSMRRNSILHSPFSILNLLWLLIVALGLGALFIGAAAGALPPFGLVFQDGAALSDWFARVWRAGLIAGAPPTSRAWAFLGESLPRAWRDLLAAPGGGEKGARLLVSVGGVASIWVGALALGWGLAHRRAVLGWGLPLLVSLAALTILSAGSSFLLIGGLGLLLLLAISTDFRGREAGWDRAGVDFSNELMLDVLTWGGFGVVVILILAALLPAWLDNPIAGALWPNIEPPSGLAVLDRNIQRTQRGPPVVEPGISKLPALQLGLSLEQAPSTTVALRVRLVAPDGGAMPLPDSPWPHYWRARVFNLYTGRAWTTNARVRPLEPLEPKAGAFPGAILQDVEDAQPDRQLILALPDAIAVSIPANVERLPDGAQAALTSLAPAERYRVLSQPQELAPLPPEGQQPDMRGYLGLPQNLPPQVGETARSVVIGRAGPYEQALALEGYLRALRYSYQVQPLPGDGDAVYQFLFDMRRGYCTYYASAMAVMARSLGIPARVATGYATGTYDRANGVYIVHEDDAHAWPELFIDGRWLPFEPTPIRSLPARAGNEEPRLTAVPSAEEQPGNVSGPLIWLAVLACVGLLTAAGLWLGRHAAPVPPIVRAQMRLERHGARAGIPWPAGATLHEYGALLEPRLDGAAGALREVIELIEQVRYGGRELRADDQRRLREAEEQVWERLKRRERRA